MKKLVTLLLAQASTPALSHTGHLAKEAAHSFLHVEHIIVLMATILIAFVIYQKNK